MLQAAKQDLAPALRAAACATAGAFDIMQGLPQRWMKIAEAAALVGVDPHLLRQWEAKFPQLKPRRNRSGRRMYSPEDIAVARRIKQLLHHERMTIPGARVRLAQELHGEGRPRTRREARELIDRIETELRTLIDDIDAALE